MHGTNKDGARRNKGRGMGGEEGREIEIEREREMESRVGILSSVGRRSPPQLSFDLCRPPQLPPPHTHAPLLFYPLGERFRES